MIEGKDKALYEQLEKDRKSLWERLGYTELRLADMRTEYQELCSKMLLMISQERLSK
jgi:hypothetical protein